MGQGKAAGSVGVRSRSRGFRAPTSQGAAEQGEPMPATGKK